MENTNVTPEMTAGQILEVISSYKKEFIQNYVLPIEYTDQGFTTLPKIPNPNECAQHCHWMIIEVENQIMKGEYEIGKLNRWLGFIQGCLFSIGAHSISEMRNHNRTNDKNITVEQVYEMLKISLQDVEGIKGVGFVRSAAPSESYLLVFISNSIRDEDKEKIPMLLCGFNIIVKIAKNIFTK